MKEQQLATEGRGGSEGEEEEEREEEEREGKNDFFFSLTINSIVYLIFDFDFIFKK